MKGDLLCNIYVRYTHESRQIFGYSQGGSVQEEQCEVSIRKHKL